MPYLKERGLGVINASPLSMGLLTPQVGGCMPGLVGCCLVYHHIECLFT